MDDAQKATDKRIETIRKRLSAEYKQAEKELTKQVNEYYSQFKSADLKKRELVKQKKLSQADYIKWRENKMLYGKTMEQKVESMAQHLLHVDKQASAIVNKEMFGVYADNYNFAKFDVEKGLKINTSFTLFDEKTVERMAEKNPKLLRERKGNDGKIIRWSRRKVNTAITQGVLQGESIDKIAKRLQNVVGMEEGFAMTNARTAMTAAQNAGRLDSLMNSKTLGIKVKKQWMATLDERTRSSHQALDGEIVDINKPFSNKLMYPGDPDGAPAEIYNCRCTMIGVLGDYPRDKFERYDNIDGKPIENVTYKEWLAAKKKASEAPTIVEKMTKSAAIETTANGTSAYEKIISQAEANNVEYLDVSPLERTLSDQEIISKLAGGDMTMGSCVSLAMAYAGNVGGYDVLDFRGGMSVKTFAMHITNKQLVNLDGVVAMESMNFSSVKGATELIAQMKDDKIYMLVTGKHASIVKKINGEAYYLELQSAIHSGWHPFTKDTLRQRFGCTRSRTVLGTKVEQHSYAIDVDSLSKSEEFHKLLGYINTEEGKQRKGKAGYAK